MCSATTLVPQGMGLQLFDLCLVNQSPTLRDSLNTLVFHLFLLIVLNVHSASRIKSTRCFSLQSKH